jgi:hypothetical protein
LDEKNCAEIGEQRKRQPFEDDDIAGIGHEDLYHGAQATECEHIEGTGPPDKQLNRIAHRPEIGSDVHDVGEQQQPNDGLQYAVGVMPRDIRGDAAASRAPDARANFLNDRHERIGKKQCPADREAELRACLRIGGDAARIVVRGAGDEAWPKRTKEAFDPPVRASSIRS